jgi:hypothetical protein
MTMTIGRIVRAGLLVSVAASALAAIGANAAPLPLRRIAQVPWDSRSASLPARPARAAKPSNGSEIADAAGWQMLALRQPAQRHAIARKRVVRLIPPTNVRKVSVIRR